MAFQVDAFQANAFLLSFMVGQTQAYIRNGTNFALASLGASAAASSTYPGYPASQSIDTDINTLWASNDSTLADDWLSVDLGTIKSIYWYRLRQPSGNTHSASSFYVQWSNDNSSWTTVLTHTTSGNVENVGYFTPILARYWRFYAVAAVTGGGGWEIGTVELWGYELQVYGQTQTNIFNPFRLAQALAFILGPTAYAQAQTYIAFTAQLGTPVSFASNIVPGYYSIPSSKSYGQAQAQIKQTYQNYGQAHSWIKQTYRGFGQANVMIGWQRWGQAMAQIKQTYRGFGQAKALTPGGLVYDITVAADGAVGHWPLTDASGTTAVALVGPNGTYSSSGITYQISAPMATNGVYKGITTTSAYMYHNMADKTGNFAIEAWFKTTATTLIPTEAAGDIYGGYNSSSNNNLWFAEQRGGERGLGVGVGTNGIVVQAHGNFNFSAPAVYSGTISTGWHHLVINVISNVPYIYLDNVLVRTGLNPGVFWRPVRLLSGDAWGPYNGSVDNVAFYDTSLTTNQIRDHYNAGVPRGYGQALAQIILGKIGFGQAQAFIFTTYWHGQAQTLLNTGLQTAQANADIKATDRKFGQTLAQISRRYPTNYYRDRVVADAPIAYWRLGELTGTTAVDEMGSYNGTYYNSPSLGQAGIVNDPNTSVRFNNGASTQQMRVPDASALKLNGSHSIEMWVNPVGGSSFPILIAKGIGDSVNSYLVYWTAGGSAVYKRNGFESGISGVSANSWHHLVITYDATAQEVKFYLDNVLTATYSKLFGTNTGSQEVRIGVEDDNSYLNGTQDEIALYNYALTADQINVHYNLAIRGASFPYGQAQARITGLGLKSGQALASIINFIKHGQAQVYISPSFDQPKFGQAQAQILTFNNNRFGQANALIQDLVSILKYTGGVWTTESAFNQPNYNLPPALSLTAVFIPDETGIWTFKTYADDAAQFYINNTLLINDTHPVTPTTATITLNVGQVYTFHVDFQPGGAPNYLLIYYKRPSDTQLWFLTDNAPPWIKHPTVQRFAQAQARIVATDVNKFGQALAFIGNIKHGQAQASILITAEGVGQAQAVIGHLQYAQTQARILATYQGYGQAQVLVPIATRYGQAQAQIKARVSIFGQALAFIGHIQIAQAQAKLNAFNVPRHGQALVFIGHIHHGQAQADIKQTYSSSGQANFYIRPRVGIGLAQAKLNAFNVNKYGQTWALIVVHDNNKYGQTRVIIILPYATGQALAQIKTGRTRKYAQARVYIGHIHSGQAMALIQAHWYGQAQADIKQKYRGYGQAVVDIQPWKYSSQALALIAHKTDAYGQANSIINQALQAASAQAEIMQTYNGRGQTKTWIKTTYFALAQAQSMTYYRRRNSGQANALIVRAYRGYGQAQTQIGSFKFAQAQARLLSFNVPRTGQAQGYILANITITPSTPTSSASSYLVRYDGFDIPGYAQKESNSSIQSITHYTGAYADFSLAEYLGLTNKIITIDMRLWEENYYLCKQKLALASTLLRRPKDFARLYVQFRDKHYLALVDRITSSKTVNESSRILDYTIEFEVKPWLIGETLKSISGTGIINTTGRTLNDGTWTPTVVTVTGTDITITGYTDTAVPTGTIEIAGSVTDFVIDTENFTASDTSVINKDFEMYVGPGVTYFQITGASSCTITYYNRWNL